MVEDREAEVKFTFSGHESFVCRQLWLKKGYDFVKSGKSFNDVDAVVALGVGKNMVASIRYWLKCFNITTNKDELTIFGNRLLDDNGWDPFLEDEGSLWLLQYYLVKTGLASTYDIIFNEFRKEKIEFTRPSYVNYIKRRSETDSRLIISENTLEEDFSKFVKMYVVNEDIKDIEDSYAGILTDLNLVRTFTKEKNNNEKNSDYFYIENNDRKTIPDHVLLFSILNNDNYGNSISIAALEQDKNGPGNIFALSRTGLIDKIQNLVKTNKYITYTDHAGIKELQFKHKPDPISILELYYGQ